MSEDVREDLTQGSMPRRRGPMIHWVIVGIAMLCFFALGYGMVRTNTQNAQAADTAPTPQSDPQTYGTHRTVAYGAGQYHVPTTYTAGASAAPSATPVPPPTVDPAIEKYAMMSVPPLPTIAPAGEGETIVYDAAGSASATTTSPTQAGAFVPSAVASASQSAANAATQVADTVPAIAQQQNQRPPFAMPNIESTPAPIDIGPDQDILAQFDQDIDSDLAGIVRAHLLNDVCDPRNRGVGFPAGSKLLGMYGGSVAQGRRHLGFSWFRMTFPDGTRIALSYADTEDLGGHEGVTGRVDTHAWQLFRDNLVQTLANGSVQIGVAALSHGTNVSIGQITPQLAAGTQPQGPTFTIPASTPFHVALAADYEAMAPYHGEYCRDN